MRASGRALIPQEREETQCRAGGRREKVAGCEPRREPPQKGDPRPVHALTLAFWPPEP